MGTALLSALATLPGQALPRQVDRDDVIAALGVAPEPSHYVIAVDTSTSMSKAGRWESVTSSLAAFSATLLAEDRVSLISFDDTATVVLEGVTPPPIRSSKPFRQALMARQATSAWASPPGWTNSRPPTTGDPPPSS